MRLRSVCVSGQLALGFSINEAHSDSPRRSAIPGPSQRKPPKGMYRSRIYDQYNREGSSEFWILRPRRSARFGADSSLLYKIVRNPRDAFLVCRYSHSVRPCDSYHRLRHGTAADWLQRVRLDENQSSPHICLQTRPSHYARCDESASISLKFENRAHLRYHWRAGEVESQLYLVR